MDEIAYSSNQFAALASPEIHMLDKAEGIHLWIIGTLVTLKALGNETGGGYSLFEDMTPPGEGPPLHIHTREEETWYMLDGEQEWTVGDKVFTATPGSFVHLPRFVPHTFKNTGDKPGTKLLTYAPAGFEMFFIDTGVPVAERYAPGEPPELTPELIEKFIVFGKKYGLVFPDTGSKAADE